ncbi:MAG: pimeloyl-ACP methyl ester carboxylesterase [Cellvibrionaceae bacterium]|jgi:pimeloyl-ACP methyl ester carboxylesterase
MSSIVTEQGILHYETLGRGKPIILLHGWINSWDVWRDSMIHLAKDGVGYRVYALDFWGFGMSNNDSPETAFQIDSYVDMVKQFMDKLGIQEAPIFGHSMGGTVALKFGIRFPEKVSRIVIVGTPIIGKTLNFFLKLSGNNYVASMVWKYPFLRDTVMRLLLAGDQESVRTMLMRDVRQANMHSFFRSIGDLYSIDLCAELASNEVPILGIFGKNDNIVSPLNAGLLKKSRSDATIAIMEKSRHFPMIDESQRFLQLIDNFLSTKIDVEQETSEI